MLSVDNKVEGSHSVQTGHAKKLTKWGAKGFAVCDVRTPHLVDFNVYTGVAEHVDGGMNLATAFRSWTDLRTKDASSSQITFMHPQNLPPVNCKDKSGSWADAEDQPTGISVDLARHKRV